MSSFNLDREIARLILFQRTEINGPFLKKLRKIFGRYIYTNVISKFLIPKKKISSRYFQLMLDEYNLLSRYLDFNNKKILSIGSGMCGLELQINRHFSNNFYSIIEKNYVSKKIRYGWDNKNHEAYNNIELLRLFLIKNQMKENAFEIFDFDTNNLPVKNYDYIISLYSLDYHYDFALYIEYFKKIINDKTKIIFDTIRPEYFQNIFENVEVIRNDQKIIHGSKRIICNKIK
tara:strand:- start:1294 stop:1989 length:696 start_codon:yes stop_codon:yes gene_type:complete